MGDGSSDLALGLLSPQKVQNSQIEGWGGGKGMAYGNNAWTQHM